MSRIGKQPIDVPAGVTVTIDPGRVTVHGPKGELRQVVPQRMSIEQEDGQIVVTRPTERGPDRSLHGLTRTLVANMVEGVTNGFEKRLEIQGVGYRAALARHRPRAAGRLLAPGQDRAAHGHRVRGARRRPQVDRAAGIDKQMVGQTAAEIRKVRPPEPYKGKGIRYEGEFVRRKVGKRA